MGTLLHKVALVTEQGMHTLVSAHIQDRVEALIKNEALSKKQAHIGDIIVFGEENTSIYGKDIWQNAK